MYKVAAPKALACWLGTLNLNETGLSFLKIVQVIFCSCFDWALCGCRYSQRATRKLAFFFQGGKRVQSDYTTGASGFTPEAQFICRRDLRCVHTSIRQREPRGLLIKSLFFASFIHGIQTVHNIGSEATGRLGWSYFKDQWV